MPYRPSPPSVCRRSPAHTLPAPHCTPRAPRSATHGYYPPPPAAATRALPPRDEPTRRIYACRSTATPAPSPPSGSPTSCARCRCRSYTKKHLPGPAKVAEPPPGGQPALPPSHAPPGRSIHRSADGRQNHPASRGAIHTLAAAPPAPSSAGVSPPREQPQRPAPNM